VVALSLAEQLEDYCREAGIKRDTPLYAALSTTVRAAEAAMAAAGMAQQAIAGARGLTPDGEAALVRRVAGTAGAATREGMARMARDIRWGVVVGIVGACVVAMSAAWGTGYYMGQGAGTVSVQITDKGAQTLCGGRPHA